MSVLAAVRSGLAGCVMALAAALVTPALAVQPDELLKDPALEARARLISSELRCLVCQNQSIDDSDAPLAKDLRVLVRERLTAGDSDAAVRDYVVARYGDFVLLKPPVNAHTLLLWLAPLFVLLGAGLIVFRTIRQPAAKEGPAVPLSAGEEDALQKILAQAEDGKPRGA